MLPAPDCWEPPLLSLVQSSAASVSRLKSRILPASCCELSYPNRAVKGARPPRMPCPSSVLRATGRSMLQEATEPPQRAHPQLLVRNSRWQHIPLGKLPPPAVAMGRGPPQTPWLAQALLRRCNLASPLH